ncbi:unnamed protein product [Cunninghamella echinulata]
MGFFNGLIQHIIRGYEDGSQTIKQSLDTTFENSRQYLQEQKESFEHLKTEQLENLKSLEEEQRKVWSTTFQRLQTEYIKTVDQYKHNLGQLIQQFQVQQQQQQQCMNASITMEPHYYFSSMEEKLFESKKNMQEYIEKLKISTQLKFQQLFHHANNDNNNNNNNTNENKQQRQQQIDIKDNYIVDNNNNGYSAKKGSVSIGVQCDLIKPNQNNMNNNFNGNGDNTVYSNHPTETCKPMNNILWEIEDFYSYASELFWDESAHDNSPQCDDAILNYDGSLLYGNIYGYGEFSPALPVDFYRCNDPSIFWNHERVYENTSDDHHYIEDIYENKNTDNNYMAEVYENDQLMYTYDALMDENIKYLYETEKCQEDNDEPGECFTKSSTEEEYDVVYSVLEESIEGNNATDIENESSTKDSDMIEKKDKNNDDWEIL